MSDTTNQVSTNASADGKQVKSPEKKGFLSGMKTSFGSLKTKMAGVASSASTAVSDANVATPKMEKIGAESRYDIEDDKVHDTKQCYVYVSCSVGKEIRDKIKAQLEEAAREFNASLGKLEDPTGSINDLKKFSTEVGVKATNVQNAKNAYDKKCNAIIPLNPPLECKLSVKNTVNAQGEEVKKIDGKIVEINPKNRTLKLEGTGHIKTSKGIVEHKVKMSSMSVSSAIEVNISELCVGGATVDDNVNSGSCFAQHGGSKKSHKAEILEISSDVGICD